MSFIPWEVPIRTGSKRSTELKEFKFDRHALIFKLIEEDTEKTEICLLSHFRHYE